MVERLREGILASPVDIGAEKLISVTASFGLAQLSPDLTVEQSIECADAAMYEAKAAGRNCSRVLIQTMTKPEMQGWAGSRQTDGDTDGGK